MEKNAEKWRAHKKRSCILVFGLVIFFNCFGFPVYNLGRAWPLSIVAEYICISVESAVFTGGALAALFPEKRCGFIVLLTAVLACAGMGCRFLLEFGEVSNTYNFTLPNMALHLGVFLGLSELSWLYAVKSIRARA